MRCASFRQGSPPCRRIRLSDDELTAVLSAARPLAVQMRDPFLRAVATALQGSEVIGPGVVARTCAELQRQFFDPPEFTCASGAGKLPTASLLAAPFASPLVAVGSRPVTQSALASQSAARSQSLLALSD